MVWCWEAVAITAAAVQVHILAVPVQVQPKLPAEFALGPICIRVFGPT
jgi:hypothetical protein